MNREELFENMKTLAREERDERRKEDKEIFRELKEIKELLKEKTNRVITRWNVRIEFTSKKK